MNAVHPNPVQITLGEWLKEKGIAQVSEHTPEAWKAVFKAVAAKILAQNGSVSSEEVLEVVGLPPAHKNSIGATMSSFARAEKLKCSYEKSDRPSRHRAVVARWYRS